MTQPNPAPHGYDANGVPNAPYGLNLDGSPRKSNRGARPGQRKGTAGSSAKKPAGAPTVKGSLSDEDRKGMLLELADMLIVSPLASASQVPAVQKRIGRSQADALAGDAFILTQYLPGVADGLLLLSKTKPAALAWLDKAEQNAPYMVLVGAILQAGKAVAENHMKPNPNVAAAGRSLAAMRIAAMADAVNAQAARMAPPASPAFTEPTQEFTVQDFENAAYANAANG